jgi:hypothetical protein
LVLGIWFFLWFQRNRPAFLAGYEGFAMTWLWNLDLIRFFDFYLAVVFLTSTYLRFRQYRDVASITWAVPGRWPRLLQLLNQHKTILLTWSFALPTVLAFCLMLIQWLASMYFWHQASLTVGEVTEKPLAWPVLAVFGAAMVGVDLYCTFVVGEVDRTATEKYFDQAEYWLKSWKAPVVRFFTLGRINPRKMVAVEVQKALVDASRLINSSLWWVTAQIGLRVAFGLAMWLTYALTGS